MTTRLRSINASKGLPVNYCSGFRSLSMALASEVDGFFSRLLIFFILFLLAISPCIKPCAVLIYIATCIRQLIKP